MSNLTNKDLAEQLHTEYMEALANLSKAVQSVLNQTQANNKKITSALKQTNKVILNK